MMNNLTATVLGNTSEVHLLTISCDEVLACQVINFSGIRTNIEHLELERLQLLSWKRRNDISTQNEIE